MSHFHLLLEEQIPKLMRYAAALTRDADVAGDLVEDAVREALDHQKDCRGNLRLWLLTTMHDLRGNPFRAMTLASPPPHEPAARLTLSGLDRALGELAEEQRAVILLIGLERLCYAEAAAVLRMTIPQLRARLPRARAELRRLMGVRETRRAA